MTHPETGAYSVILENKISLYFKFESWLMAFCGLDASHVDLRYMNFGGYTVQRVQVEPR